MAARGPASESCGDSVWGVCVCVRVGGVCLVFFYLNLKDHFANPDLGTLSQKYKQIETFPGDQRKMPFLLRLGTIPLVTSEFIATLTIFLVVKLLIYLCLPGFYFFSLIIILSQHNAFAFSSQGLPTFFLAPQSV